MKLAVFFICFWCSYGMLAQTPGEWTWMSGSSTSGNAVYGTMGTPGPNVTPGGGCIYESRFWTDLNGNFWLYGGMDLTSGVNLDNLWKYNVSTNQWTWVRGSGSSGGFPNYGTQGVFSNSNNPPSSGISQSVSWIDANGDFWLYSSTDFYGSMWKYDVSLNQWAWMHGNIPQNDGVLGVASPLNNPGFIGESPVSWVDDTGCFWFLDGYNGGVMWKYDPNNNQWTRMHGFTQMGTGAPNFGTKGVFTATNAPGMRWTYQYWKSDDGKFYMFGNNAMDMMTGEQYMGSDMWAFNPAINQWAWVGGTQGQTTVSSFTALGNFSSTNVPSNSMEEINNWKDECNRFWAYNIMTGFLWCYDPAIDQFAWMDGDLQENPVSYGVQGVSSPLNNPSSYSTANGTSASFGVPHWTDQNGDFWMIQNLSDMNWNSVSSAMWRYVPLSGAGSVNFTAEPDSLCLGDSVVFTPSIIDNESHYEWDFGISNSTLDTSSVITPTFTYLNAGNYNVQLIYEGTCGSDTIVHAVLVNAPPLLDVTSDTICEGESAQLMASGAMTYSWAPANQVTPSTGASVSVTPTVTSSYIVTGANNGCEAKDTAFVVVFPQPDLSLSDSLFACIYDSIPLTVSGAETYSWSPSTGLSATTGNNIFSTTQQTIWYQVIGVDSLGCQNKDSVLVYVEVPNMSVNSAKICLNDPSDIETLTVNGANVCVWSPPTGLSAVSGVSVQARPDVTTDYTIYGTTTNGCKDSVTSEVIVIPLFEVKVNSDTICYGETTLLKASGAGTYQWSPPTGLNQTTGVEVEASPTSSMIYTVKGFVDECVDSAKATVEVILNPIPVGYASLTEVSNFSPFTSFVSENLGESVAWYHDQQLLSTLHEFNQELPEEPGNYPVRLIVTNFFGCQDSLDLNVLIKEEILIYVPNSFTPDGDKFNNVFKAVVGFGIDLNSFEMTLFNRWGEQVYFSKDVNEGWDGVYNGMKCQDGTYTWKIAFKSKYTDEVLEKVGSVSLIR